MGAQAERRREHRHACKGTMNWVYFNEKCPGGAARVSNFSQNDSCFETDLALVLGSAVLIRVLKCMNCLEVSKTPADLRWNTLAEVKWCQKLSDSENTPYTVGVRYHYPV
jgi:hypothetical protein